MSHGSAQPPAPTVSELPSVSIVFLAYNRRTELATSLRQMTEHSDYPPERLDITVVDNASTDGTVEMLRREFPHVRVIAREKNIGASAWNEGLQTSRGDLALILDDDCYLPPDGLRRAVLAAEANAADLVSFKVIATGKPDWVFSDKYPTGLFSFWGCAVLLRRRVIDTLGGYDPNIFIWANELEFTIRFFDSGFRHLHLPEVVAQHMKHVGENEPIDVRGYRINARHFAYIAGKLLAPRDAAEALLALLARTARDGLREHRMAFKGMLDTLAGFLRGVRHRQAVRSEVSRFYRRNFESFASPWWLSRPPGELLRELPRDLLRGGGRSTDLSRREAYFSERRVLYSTVPAMLWFSPEPTAVELDPSGERQDGEGRLHFGSAGDPVGA